MSSSRTSRCSERVRAPLRLIPVQLATRTLVSYAMSELSNQASRFGSWDDGRTTC
jgi:hypothetical protein